MRIEVNWDRCAGNGLCEFETDKYFEVQDNGKLDVLQWEVDGDDEQNVHRAVAACPTEALSITE
ncbi:ferredoxin [Saccharopolyspora sp. CA-218241]|uniref:ferredoxin n=1 Tax=Saccharopolyspora sp. CA-218241 TaxID=3240027 RepID=UPI003D99779C